VHLSRLFCVVVIMAASQASMTVQADAPATKTVTSITFYQSGHADSISKSYDLKPDQGWQILPGTSSVVVSGSVGDNSYDLIKDDSEVVTYKVNSMHSPFLPSSITFKIKAIEYRQ
jgi:hypothetical protein